MLNRDSMRYLLVAVHGYVEVATDVDLVSESQSAIGFLWEPYSFLQSIEELSVIFLLLKEIQILVHELRRQEKTCFMQEGLEWLVKL